MLSFNAAGTAAVDFYPSFVDTWAPGLVAEIYSVPCAISLSVLRRNAQQPCSTAFRRRPTLSRLARMSCAMRFPRLELFCGGESLGKATLPSVQALAKIGQVLIMVC